MVITSIMICHVAFLQCIHGGFGLKRFGKELTGPEYSQMLTEEAVAAWCTVVLNAYVTEVVKL